MALGTLSGEWKRTCLVACCTVISRLTMSCRIIVYNPNPLIISAYFLIDIMRSRPLQDADKAVNSQQAA